MKRLEPLFLVLVIVGGLNWLIIGLFETNVIAELFGAGVLADVVYVVFGLAALAFVPRLVDDLQHTGDHGVRPHRA